MTRAERIRKACALLNSRDEEEIDRAITAIDLVGKVNTGFETYYSKPSRLKVAALQKALHRVRAAHKALPDAVRAVEFDDLDLKKYIATCDDFIAQPTGPKSKPVTKQRQAASMATLMLYLRGQPTTVSSRSKWCQLAGLLADESAANMVPYCREILLWRRQIK